MPDIEQRLKILEKRARADDERWQMLDGYEKAVAIIGESVIRPICAELIATRQRERLKPKLLQVIIDNIKKFESDAQILNLHSKTIVELRAARMFFEMLAKKEGRTSPATSA